MLGKIGDNTASISSVKSRSIYDAKLAICELKPSSTKLDIKIIFADVQRVREMEPRRMISTQ